MHRTQNPTSSAADTTDDPTVVVTPDTILHGAARYLELHGWAKRSYYSDDTAFPAACALGAIGIAAHGRRLELPFDGDDEAVRDARRAAEQLNTYLNDQGIGTYSPTNWDAEPPIDVVEWNDETENTVDEVANILRAAADQYAYQHATWAQREDYYRVCTGAGQLPTIPGFAAWLGAR